MNESKMLIDAFQICKKRFGEIHLEVDSISLNVYNSRKSFVRKIQFINFFYLISGLVSLKELKKYTQDKDFVGFVRPTKIKRLINKKWEINILSPKIFERESNFDKDFFFNVVVHEMCHIFLKYKLASKFGDIEEGLCYYIADQKKYRPEEYDFGKKWYKMLELDKKRGVEKVFKGELTKC